MKTIARLASVLLGLLLLAGADSINQTVTPNPNGNLGKLKGNGTYTVNAQETVDKITFSGKLIHVGFLDNGQITFNTANRAGLNWDSLLSVTAGNYDAYAILWTKDMQNNELFTQCNPASVNVNVN